MTTIRPPKKPEEFRVWIQYQLKLKGSSFAKIGREVGVSRQAVRKSVLSPSIRIADAICADLGVSRKRLWPQRYAA
jgi:lambda repressor-like predicted transcriptional regulator